MATPALASIDTDTMRWYQCRCADTDADVAALALMFDLISHTVVAPTSLKFTRAVVRAEHADGGCGPPTVGCRHS